MAEQDDRQVKCKAEQNNQPKPQNMVRRISLDKKTNDSHKPYHKKGNIADDGPAHTGLRRCPLILRQKAQ